MIDVYCVVLLSLQKNMDTVVCFAVLSICCIGTVLSTECADDELALCCGRHATRQPECCKKLDLERLCADEQQLDEDRPSKLFLGKRNVPDDQYLLGDDEVDKRRSPFLGKRRNPFLGKRRSPFLGKRRNPFLGKRDDIDDDRLEEIYDKRRMPFLG